MTEKLAQDILRSFQSRKDVGSLMTLIDVYQMARLPCEGVQIYALQKGKYTLLAQVMESKRVWSITTEVVSW